MKTSNGASRPVSTAPGGPASPRGLTAAPALAAVLFTFAILLVPAPLAAQDPPSPSTASLGGVVVEAASRVPISGATVRVAGAEETVVTDGEGRFILYELLPGRRMLVVSYLGQATRPRAVQLVGDRHAEIEVTVELAEFTGGRPSSEGLPDRDAVIPLEDLDVDVEGTIPIGKLHGFYSRMEDGDGVFIDREEILERDPSRPSDLLREVAGIRINPSTFERESVIPTRGRQGQFRSCDLLYFLDGLEVPGFDVDDIPTRDLAGIEIYRSLAEIPPQFRRRGICAVILLWTRDPSIPDPEIGSPDAVG